MGHIADLRAIFRDTKAAWKADKTDKEAKKAYKKAKAALDEAKEAAANKKRPAGETEQPVAGETEQPVKKKVKHATFTLDKTDDKVHAINQNPPSKRVFIRNIHFDVDDEKIKEFLKDCGKLVEIHWMTKRGNFVGCGIIEFATQKGAATAMTKEGTDFMGRPFTCHYATKRKPHKLRELSEKPIGCDTIFLANLAPEVTEDKIREIFIECGDIKKIWFLINKKTGKPIGCGFVQFNDPDLALPIAVKHNGSKVSGRIITVDYSKPRNKKQRHKSVEMKRLKASNAVKT